MVRSHQWPRVAGLVWFCMAWLFLASYKGSIPDQSFAMGSSRCGLRRQRTPCRAASWVSVQDIKDIYTTEEFEKQVYAALDGGDDLLRLPFYEIRATEDKECFRERLRYPTWVQLEHGQERKRPEKGRPWCCPSIKSPMRPLLEERGPSNAPCNPFQTHVLQKC